MPLPARPRLRPIEIKRLRHEGREYFHLRDLLGLAGRDLLAPLALGPALALLDGEHDLAEVRSACLLHAGLALEPADLIDLVRDLDEALLLEGERVEAAKAQTLAAYHAAPHRPPALAGRVYPEAATDLRAQLLAFELQSRRAALPAARVAGVLSPHIDFARGGLVYAAGWAQAAKAASAAELVILLGTDHAGSGGRLTLTRQRYATPWGPLDRDEALAEALIEALGPDEAFAEELHHRNEHSIELAAVWMHHVRGGRPVRVLPVLCGHPGPLLRRGSASGEPAIDRALTVLRAACEAGALVVVAGDLAHVGPAFGDERAFGAAERAEVRAADEALIRACADGDAGLLGEVARHDDRYRVCGLTPLALALAIMPPVRLDVAAYDQCPADEIDASFVSVAGGCFVRQT